MGAGPVVRSKISRDLCNGGAPSIVRCQQWNDFSPEPGRAYFARDNYNAGLRIKNDMIAAVIPCFNEEAIELQRTLVALARQQQSLVSLQCTMSVLVVLDGWFKSSPCMKDYVKSLFPEGPQPWSELIRPQSDDDVHPTQTWILQKVNQQRDRVLPVIVGWQRSRTDPNTAEPILLKVTLIIKRWVLSCPRVLYQGCSEIFILLFLFFSLLDGTEKIGGSTIPMHGSFLRTDLHPSVSAIGGSSHSHDPMNE